MTYSYGLDDNEVIINAGELTRTFGGGGDDDFDSTYNYDMFDGSTQEEIAGWLLANGAHKTNHSNESRMSQ